VLAGGRDGDARLLRAADGRLEKLLRGPGGPVQAATLSPDETLAVLGCQEGTVRVARVPGGEVAADLHDHRDGVEAVAFSPDGRLLAAGASSSAFVWRTSNFELVGSFQHAPADQYALSTGVIGVYVHFTKNSQVLVTSGDNGLKAWAIADQQQLFSAFAARGDLSPDGSRFVVAVAGHVSTYPCDLCGGLKELLAVSRRNVTRGFTPAERARFLRLG
jgi:cytochrome c